MDSFQVTNDWLRARAVASPEAEALWFGGRVWSFREIDAMVDRLCVYLAAFGVAPGDHVGVLLPNAPTMVCCVFGLARLGAVLVPLNTRLTAIELAWQFERADCAVVLCGPSTETKARDATAGRCSVHTLPADPSVFEAWLESDTFMATTSDEQRSSGSLESVQAIVFTSGTTGRPKGAMITYSNHFWSAIGSAFRLGVRPEDRWLACLPLYHVGGLAILFRSCLYGTAVVLHDGYDTQAVLDSLKSERVTLVSLIPTMLGWLLDEGLTQAAAPLLRLVLLGGAAATPDLLARANAAGIPVAVSYGLTEAASQVATLPPGAVPGKPGSAGRPLLFTDVAILDEAGRAVAPEIPGEITVAGPTVMAGYYGDQEATEAILVNGRLRTGDIGYRDADGDLWVLNRRSDLIVSGGENVYPAEVERALREHPAVASACVVGLPDAVWGQRVAAMVVLQETGATTREELLAHCRERLAGYKQPCVLVFAGELPLTGSGKIHRQRVSELLAAEVERA
jgi:O-succinylbenzoic acid--CoA ligase